MAALEHGSPGNAYNIVDDEPVPFTDHVRAVADAFALPGPVTVPGIVLRVAAPYAWTIMTTSMRVSNAKAKAELGWRPSAASSAIGVQRLSGAAHSDH